MNLCPHCGLHSHTKKLQDFGRCGSTLHVEILHTRSWITDQMWKYWLLIKLCKYRFQTLPRATAGMWLGWSDLIGQNSEKRSNVEILGSDWSNVQSFRIVLCKCTLSLCMQSNQHAAIFWLLWSNFACGCMLEAVQCFIFTGGAEDEESQFGRQINYMNHARLTTKWGSPPVWEPLVI